ncbi:MAG: AAA family ATPase [Nitrospirae bacterium]|nr:AAA family ATPase [Nitrospirota bacterium]
MDLEEKALKRFWEQKDAIFLEKKELTDRFELLSEKIDALLNLKLDIFKENIKPFAPNKDGLLSKKAHSNMLRMSKTNDKKIQNIFGNAYNNELAKSIWFIWGSVSEDEYLLDQRFRIISNNYKFDDYNGGLNTDQSGQSTRTVSNIASNNYYFQFAKFLQVAKEDMNYQTAIDESKLVLTWENNKELLGSDDPFKESTKLLEKRFPPKYLWMWANKDTVLHPFSLMAFRNFVNSPFGGEILKDINPALEPPIITNMEFDTFVKQWKLISVSIFNKLGIDNNPDNSKNLSKLLSVIMVDDIEVNNSPTTDNTTHSKNKILNQIFFGPPGTGKTYNTINKALEIIGEATEGKKREDIKNLFDDRMKTGQIEFITFHQSMSYEDFIEGIKPVTEPDNESTGESLRYEVKPGIFRKLCSKASLAIAKLAGNQNKKENSNNSPEEKMAVVRNLTTEDYNDKQYVLIIDEINRGNVSQIFGELITLVEEDKRLGADEGLEVTLPYSNEKFGVPPNLHIIGTMNTADRSVEALDVALRRRFSFVEMPPKPELIAKEGKLKKDKGVLDGINLPLVLTTINKRIEKLLDKDHQIGHSYFLSVSTLEDLKATFQNKIIPLLQEYFFGDYGKIGLILGKGFFTEPGNMISTDNFFADFEYDDASDFAERIIYKIKSIDDMKDADFKEAINHLLRIN